MVTKQGIKFDRGAVATWTAIGAVLAAMVAINAFVDPLVSRAFGEGERRERISSDIRAVSTEVTNVKTNVADLAHSIKELEAKVDKMRERQNLQDLQGLLQAEPLREMTRQLEVLRVMLEEMGTK